MLGHINTQEVSGGGNQEIQSRAITYNADKKITANFQSQKLVEIYLGNKHTLPVEKILHSKTLGKIARKIRKVAFRITHFTEKQKLNAVKNELKKYAFLNSKEKELLHNDIAQGYDYNIIQELSKLKDTDDITIKNLKNKADEWIKHKEKSQTICRHIFQQIRDEFLEDPEIKKLSKLERDVLSQIIADKFYEKAEFHQEIAKGCFKYAQDDADNWKTKLSQQEAYRDSYYNLYVAFCPCKNVNENWSTTQEEILNQCKKFPTTANDGISKETSLTIATELTENKKILSDNLILLLKDHCQFCKDNNRNYSATIKFPNGKVVELKSFDENKNHLKSFSSNGDQQHILHTRENMNALWNACQENFKNKEKATAVFLHFCKSNVAQNHPSLQVCSKMTCLNDGIVSKYSNDSTVKQNLNIDEAGNITFTSILHSSSIFPATNQKDVYKADIDAEVTSHHPINAEYGTYDITKTKGQVKIYNEILKPMPKGTP